MNGRLQKREFNGDKSAQRRVLKCPLTASHEQEVSQQGVGENPRFAISRASGGRRLGAEHVADTDDGVDELLVESAI